MRNSRRKVLIVGAAGRVGRVLTRGLAKDYELTATDVEPLPGMAQADMRDADRMAALCADADTVLFVALHGDHATLFDSEHAENVDGPRTVIEAAARTCRRLVFASTLMIVTDPDHPYCRQKRRIEEIAERTARDTPLSVHCLRMGRVLPLTSHLFWPEQAKLGEILTHGDLLRLFRASIEAPGAVHFGVYPGLSANEPCAVDLAETRATLGYEPEDDAFKLAQQRWRSPRGYARRLKRLLHSPWR